MKLYCKFKFALFFVSCNFFSFRQQTSVNTLISQSFLRTTMGGGTIMYIESITDRFWDNSSRRSILVPDWRRRRQIGTSEFRRHIYREGLWVRRGADLRVRESSPEFYRYVRNSSQFPICFNHINRVNY